MKVTTINVFIAAVVISCLMISGSAMADNYDYQAPQVKITKITVLPDGKSLYIYFDSQVCNKIGNETWVEWGDRVGRVEVGAQYNDSGKTVSADGLKNLLSLSMAANISGKNVRVSTHHTAASDQVWGCHITEMSIVP